jgi:hypothetical protein
MQRTCFTATECICAWETGRCGCGCLSESKGYFFKFKDNENFVTMLCCGLPLCLSFFVYFFPSFLNPILCAIPLPLLLHFSLHCTSSPSLRSTSHSPSCYTPNFPLELLPPQHRIVEILGSYLGPQTNYHDWGPWSPLVSSDKRPECSLNWITTALFHILSISLNVLPFKAIEPRTASLNKAFYCCDAVKPSALETAAAVRPFVHPPDETWRNMKRRWNDADKGKICPCVTLSTTKLIWTDLGLNQGLRREKPRSNRLGYGTT